MFGIPNFTLLLSVLSQPSAVLAYDAGSITAGVFVGIGLAAILAQFFLFLAYRKRIGLNALYFSAVALIFVVAQLQVSAGILSEGAAGIFLVLSGIVSLNILRHLRTYLTDSRSIDIPLFIGYLLSVLTLWSLVFPETGVPESLPILYFPVVIGINLIGWFYAYASITHPVRYIFGTVVGLLLVLSLHYYALNDVLLSIESSRITLFLTAALLVVMALAAYAVSTKRDEANITLSDSDVDTDRFETDKKNKEEQVAILAHEIRTPLDGINDITELLIDGAEGDLPEGVRKNLDLISSSSKKLTLLFSDLLDVSSLQDTLLQYNPCPVHLRSAINRVMALHYTKANSKGVQLRNLVAKTAPNIYVDPDRFEQVLSNLINNAVKFTKDGHVSVDAEVHDENRVIITIEDTGQGLSKEQIERIKASFQDDLIDAPASGSRWDGMGLKISNKLVKLMGSELNLESAQGFGLYVEFSVPLTNDEAQIDERFENYSIQPKEQFARITKIVPHRNINIDDKFTIMIVDDEPVNIKVLTAQLSRAGYDVVSFYNGRSALEYLKTEQIPDLVLLDVMMPNMNGFEVCKVIRGEHTPSELPVIMLTAKTQTTDVLQGFKSGANDYIGKPIAKDELLARIKTHLELSKINLAFSRFVPHEFLNYLGYENILDIKLGDQVQQNMAVMFTDIKDFTSLSENLTPKESFDFINAFLGVVSPLIRKNGGFIDKFIGDAVMALFPGGADDALSAAINISAELEKFNEKRKKSNLEPILIGTGIHSGDLMLGIIGEQLRMEGSVISDVVNTASRLEGLTKVFDSNVIVSSNILDSLTKLNEYNFRYLGKTRVKGKANILDVYGVIEGDDPQKIKMEKASAEAFEAGIKEFYDKNFTRASVHFNEVLKIHPQDKAASIFLKRSAHLMVTKVPENWSGVDEGSLIIEHGQ